MNRSHKPDLRLLLEDRATLYSGCQSVRSDLVTRTMLTLDELNLGFDSDVEEDLFLLMHRIAEEDEKECENT